MNRSVSTTYEDWQSAVRRHEDQLRNARRRGFSPAQIRELTQGTLLMVDAAYERYKQAEAAEQEHTELRIDPLEAALRALSNPFPKGHGSVH